MHPLYFIAKLSGSFKTCIGGIYMQSAKGTSMTLLVSEWVYRISAILKEHVENTSLMDFVTPVWRTGSVPVHLVNWATYWRLWLLNV